MYLLTHKDNRWLIVPSQYMSYYTRRGFSHIMTGAKEVLEEAKEVYKEFKR